MDRKLRCAWRRAANIWDYTCIGNSGEVTSCSRELRLYWHRLCRFWWCLAVTSWGSGPSDVFQSLSGAQVQAMSCSHYLKLCLHRLLRLRWRLAVTNWGYVCIGCSDLCNVLQSLSEAILRTWELNSMITSVYWSKCLYNTPYLSAQA